MGLFFTTSGRIWWLSVLDPAVLSSYFLEYSYSDRKGALKIWKALILICASQHDYGMMLKIEENFSYSHILITTSIALEEIYL